MGHRARKGGDLSALTTADKGTIIVVTKIIGPVSGFVVLDLGEPISQESEPVAGVCEIPVFIARFGNCMQIMERASRPEGDDLPR